jgi:hypothetical protein
MSERQIGSEPDDPLRLLRRRVDTLAGKREELARQQEKAMADLKATEAFLSIADTVTDALEKLSGDVFNRQLSSIEKTLTKALQEVLEQPIVFKATSSFKRDAASVEFFIERDGNQEDIMKGQGGSVANIVSVGLRLFAITTLDNKCHRNFLVLDEQDCWLAPELIPKLARIVQEAGKALGFQVLMISHHNVDSFIRHANRVYRLSPDRGQGVGVERIEADSFPS